jgi:hypothetical protein
MAAASYPAAVKSLGLCAGLLARDSRALRQEIKRISPDIDLTIQGDDGEDIAIPITLNFFWPDFNS